MQVGVAQKQRANGEILRRLFRRRDDDVQPLRLAWRQCHMGSVEVHWILRVRAEEPIARLLDPDIADSERDDATLG